MVEVKGIKSDLMRSVFESMTNDRAALKLLSIGIVNGISSIVQPPCEDSDPF